MNGKWTLEDRTLSQRLCRDGEKTVEEEYRKRPRTTGKRDFEGKERQLEDVLVLDLRAALQAIE